MKIKTLSIIFFIGGAILISATSMAADYSVKVTNPSFRWSITTPKGTVLPAAPDHGLSYLGSPAESSELISKRGNTTTYRVTNTKKQTALVSFARNEHTLEITIKLENNETGTIALRAATPGPAYGLGDRGGRYRGRNANLSAQKQETYITKIDKGGYRWVSSFLIFPQQGVAGVSFEKQGGSVSIGPDLYEMTNTSVHEHTYHYYVGTPQEIYAAYRETRIAQGFPGVKPKMVGFELGWETFAVLGWDGNEENCRASIQGFLDRGYPIKWASIGSGFWKTGGTTLHFGEFNKERFPDTNGSGRPDFIDWCKENDIKMLVGQRINFVKDGGSHKSAKPSPSGNTLFDTSPGTQTGLDNNYFLKEDNKEITRTSTAYPTVPCYILNGNAPGAAEWYKELYDKWGVDGVKEDTMMYVPDHTIYNAPFRLIAESGDFVMARCGAYSSPGTILRINDTSGPKLMTLRCPINYLQYAASGAPNVYSDTIGFKSVTDVEATIRHAWLLSLTAGIGVSVAPWDCEWSDADQKKLKKAVDLHCQLVPYMYSAAIDSHETGFPHTMTPLHIAYPDDLKVHHLANEVNRQFEWMIGPSLLAAPLLHDNYRETDRMNIYLPTGKWIDYESGQVYQGPKTLKDFEMPLDKIPLFVGGKGVFVLRHAENKPLKAVVYPISRNGSSYSFTHPDGKPITTIINNNDGWDTSKLKVTDTTTGVLVSFRTKAITGSISFDITPAHNYELTGGL